MLKTLLCSIFPLIIFDILLEFCELFMTSISFEMMNTLTWQLIVICFTEVVVVTKDKQYQGLPTPPFQAYKKKSIIFQICNTNNNQHMYAHISHH